MLRAQSTPPGDLSGRKRVRAPGANSPLTCTPDGVGRTAEKREALDSGAVVTSWEWNDLDLVTELTDDKGSDALYAFDDLGRPLQKTTGNARTVSCVCDANGNVEGIPDLNGTVIVQGFDELDRLIGREVTPATAAEGDTEEGVVYDASGRPTDAADDGSTVQMMVDRPSRTLTEAQGGNPLGTTGRTVSFTWDAESNRTQAGEARQQPGRRT